VANFFKAELRERIIDKRIPNNFIEIREEFSGLLELGQITIDSGHFILMLKKVSEFICLIYYLSKLSSIVCMHFPFILTAIVLKDF